MIGILHVLIVVATIILTCIFTLPIVAFYFFSLYKLFEKCGVPGWKSLIPIYNKYVEIRIAGMHWWYILMYVCSFFFFIDGKTGVRILCLLIIMFAQSVLNYNLCKRINSNKNNLLIDFLLLTFIPVVYLPIMALNDKYVYHPEVEVTPNAYIDEIQTSNFQSEEDKKKTNVKKKYCIKCGQPLTNSTLYCPHCGKKV